ncbi:MAG: hypothetical protein JXB48_22420 [Candidatus Latescibacteria bacterium]|nr:hypothetical protein [Candidatus Latescibacterota bacterium]
MKQLCALVLLCIMVLNVTGCSDDDDNNPVGPGNTGGKIAVITTSGDDEYNISVINIETGEAYNDLFPLNGTSDVLQYGDDVYIVDKSGDRIIKFDPYGRSIKGEMSTGAGTAPNTIVFVSATKAYVPTSDVPYITIINPTTMEVTGTIDISAMADDDGDPDQFHAAIKGNRLYVALRRSSGRSLSDHSSLAVIDITTDTVVKELKLQTNGISGSNKYSIGGLVQGDYSIKGNIYPYVIGSITDATDGAIELIDEESLTTQALYSETDIGGNLTLWVFDTNTTGWAIAGLSDTNGGEGWGLIRFNLIAGTFDKVSDFQGTVLTRAIDFTDDGLVLAGRADENNPGVFIYDSKNDYKPVFDNAIDVGLLPWRILVVR